MYWEWLREGGFVTHTDNTVTTPGSTRRLFVSYAREDRDAVVRLGGGLARLRHDVWVGVPNAALLLWALVQLKIIG